MYSNFKQTVHMHVNCIEHLHNYIILLHCIDQNNIILLLVECLNVHVHFRLEVKNSCPAKMPTNWP